MPKKISEEKPRRNSRSGICRVDDKQYARGILTEIIVQQFSLRMPRVFVSEAKRKSQKTRDVVKE